MKTLKLKKKYVLNQMKGEAFCHVYTDKNNNVNRLFLNID